MIMITGGAFQGKTDYVKERFSFLDKDISDGEKCELKAVFSAKCVKNYHCIVKRLLAENISPTEFTRQLCRENPSAVIVINEIGCGIIPLEKCDRIWREETGKSGCIIAENSDKVIRISCGIPMKIKG